MRIRFFPILILLVVLAFTVIPAWAAQITLATGKSVDWPPQVGKPYPELELADAAGKIVKLSDFRGKVLLIEPIGMTCAACNAFAGGATKGGVKGIEVQSGLQSMEEYFPQYTGGLSVHDDRIVFIHLLLYNLSMQGPTREDVQLWASHFGIEGQKNTYVLAGGPALVGPASYALIPGFQLVDRNFILRSDATGDNPKEDIWRGLLPMVPKLLDEKVR